MRFLLLTTFWVALAMFIPAVLALEFGGPDPPLILEILDWVGLAEVGLFLVAWLVLGVWAFAVEWVVPYGIPHVKELWALVRRFYLNGEPPP